VSVINFAKIHKLVFDIPCLRNLITHRHRDTWNQLHNQLCGWWLAKITIWRLC